jgi:hypothetical protein
MPHQVVDIEKDGGAKSDDLSWDTVWKNGAVLNTTLQALSPGDTLVIPNKTFYVMGGIQASNLQSVTIQIDGTLAYASTTLNAEKYIKQWPRSAGGGVHECMQFSNCRNVTFTSSGKGTLDGEGAKWWGVPGVGYLVRQENRPRLLHISGSQDIVVEVCHCGLCLFASSSSLMLLGVRCSISSSRTARTGPSLPTASMGSRFGSRRSKLGVTTTTVTM